MTAPRISLVEGLHLTATNRRHLSQILANGWTRGESGRLSYQLEPIDLAQGLYRYQIGQMECARILREIADKLENGSQDGAKVYDLNGNAVGRWDLFED